MVDFTLARKQLKVLRELEKPGIYLTKVKRLAPAGYTEDEWEYANYPGDYKLPRIALHVVHDLLSFGLVMYRNEDKTECELDISGCNYLKSLEIPDEDRLDMDKLYRIHQLIHNPMQKEKKRQK